MGRAFDNFLMARQSNKRRDERLSELERLLSYALEAMRCEPHASPRLVNTVRYIETKGVK
jgi:hypothetical protein